MGAIPIAMVAGAGLGAVKHHQDEVKYNRQKQLAADIERNSAWTGVHGQMPNDPGSAFGDMLQGGLSGGMFANQFGGSPSTAASGAEAAKVSAFDPSKVQGFNLTGQDGGVGGGANPFGLNQDMAYGGSSWANPTLYGKR